VPADADHDTLMENWNLDLYSAINAPAHLLPWLLEVARAAAEWPVYFTALLLVALWVRGRPAARARLIAASAAVACALALNLLIGELWYQPRPFVLGLGDTFVTHAPDASFPSDRATLIWGFGFALLAGGLRRGGRVIDRAGRGDRVGADLPRHSLPARYGGRTAHGARLGAARARCARRSRRIYWRDSKPSTSGYWIGYGYRKHCFPATDGTPTPALPIRRTRIGRSTMLETAAVAFTTFLATIGPIDVAAMFAALTVADTAAQRRSTALRGTLIATGILIGFALFGKLLLARFGISLAALRTAGGILLVLISIDMVFARNSGGTSTTQDENREAEDKEDIAVFPLATPLIAGPGAMGAAILLVADAEGDLNLESSVDRYILTVTG